MRGRRGWYDDDDSLERAGARASTSRKSARATASRSKRRSSRPRRRSRSSTRSREAGWRRSRSRRSFRRRRFPRCATPRAVMRSIRAPARRGLHRAGPERARRRARDRVRHRRVEPRDVGERNAQPGQPADDARAVVRGAVARRSRWRGRPACRINVSLSCSFGCPMEGDVPADDRARLVRALRRARRARRHALRHHRHGLSDARSRASDARFASAGPNRADPALPQHARHGARQRARCRSTKAPTASTPRSAAWAAVLMRPAPPATSAPRRSSMRSS